MQGCPYGFGGTIWREAEALHLLRAEGVLTLAAVVQEGAVYFDEALEPGFRL